MLKLKKHKFSKKHKFNLFNIQSPRFRHLKKSMPDAFGRKASFFSLSTFKISQFFRYYYFSIKKHQLKKCKKSNLFFYYINLEKRLDVILYRTNFSSSIKESKQLILHGHIAVNNNVVTYPSYKLSSGDIVSRTSFFNSNQFKDKYYLPVPEYLYVRYINMTSVYLYNPSVVELPMIKIFRSNLKKLNLVQNK